MRFKSLLAFACAAGMLLPAAAASARPDVALHLSATVVEKTSNGVEHNVPIEASTKLKTGQLVRYTISAYNKGSDAALHLAPVGKVPAGTAYVAGSASDSASRVEFSVDGGKTWSTKPTVTVQSASGALTKPADPSSFTTIRWTSEKPLAPKGSTRFSYEVRVK
jgi:uncharacterized repeat protein (TIGR01451 family)